jgi:CBS domain-containing protein
VAIIRPEDPIRLLVSVPMVTIESNASLAELAAKIAVEQVGAVAVMSGNHLEGVVSERDIVRAVAAHGEPEDVWAADVMSGEPVRIDGEDSILAAARLMLDEGVRNLPVMSDDHVLGVVSVRDVLRVLTDAWQRCFDDQT